MITSILIITSAIELVIIAFLLFMYKKQKRRIEIAETIPAKPSSDHSHAEWIVQMYNKYCSQWSTFFAGINYPLSAEDKAKIFELLWNISSITIDFLMVGNNDPNVLLRNKDAVTTFLSESVSEQNLKEFHRDPTTIPRQVIAIYDIFKELNYKGEIVAFGYKLKF